MSAQEKQIPFVYLENEVGRNFDIRPLRRTVIAEEIDEVPHRHGFQELLWVKSGSGRHRIDDAILEIEPSTFYLIAKGQIHYFIEGHDLDGYILRFSDDFLTDDITTEGWNYRVTLFSHFSVHQTLSPETSEIESFQELLDRMYAELKTDAFGNEHILRYLLSILIILLERARLDLPQTEATSDPNLDLFQRFVDVLETDFKQEHSVNYYASRVHITPRQLSDIAKTCTGKTAKTLIIERIILEAKRYLQYSNHSIKEIAFVLGFKDASYFSKVFKSMTGVSPNEYTNEI